MPNDRSRARAWVVEQSGDPTIGEDSLTALGLFSSHVERDPPGTDEPGPERVPPDEAIAWSRARAARVIVRVCGGEQGTIHYSAGETPIEWEEGPLPQWPAEGLQLAKRRLPLWEHVDRTDADDPIDWDVIVRPLQGWGKPVEGFGRAFAAALRSHGQAALVDWRELPGGGFSDDERAGEQGIVGFAGEGNPAAEGLIRLSARTLEEAERVANGVCREATAVVLEARGQTLDGHPMPWSSEAHAYPTGSRAAAMNARLADASGELL